MKKYIRYILLSLLLADVIYSLIQHYHMPLEGDMACIITPSDGYKHLMSDPLGISALKGDVYPGTNRFFAHWTMATYFKIAPFVCQLVINPIDSIYLSNAIAKTGIQLFLILLLALYISRSRNIFSKDFLIAAILVTPLFQAWGFNKYIGIIDKSITYTFFYALPLGLLMLFFLPFYNASMENRNVKLHPLIIILLIPFIVYLSLNGPLNPAVVLLICPLFILNRFCNLYFSSSEIGVLSKINYSFKNVSKVELFLFVFFSILCLYSIYIGRFNSENFNKTLSLSDRYALLPKGIYQQLKSTGTLLILLVIGINSLIIYRLKQDEEAKRIITILKWIIVFSIIYTLLLPFGGYREYRPLIVRWDTFMPVNLCLFYFYGISTLFILNKYISTLKIVYTCGITAILLIFTLKDKVDYNASTCEKESLKIIAKSTEKIVLIESNCSVMSWGKITNYEDSKFNTQYLKYIGVLKEEKYYYQK